MCGRFPQSYTWEEVHRFLRMLTPSATPNLRPRYNIAPTTLIDVVVDRGNGRELVSMRWGLIPGWWKKKANEVGATFNAVGEEAATKPMFRFSFKARRCIIPALGFYEWTGPKTDRQSHYFTRADREILAFAGLWERWTNPENGEEVPIVLDHHDRREQMDERVSHTYAGGACRKRLRRLAPGEGGA